MLDEEEILGRDQIRPLKRVEYERMVSCGIFADENVELLRGFLVRMPPQNGPHADAVAQLHQLLVLALRERALVRGHSPYAANDESEPEPDLAVVSVEAYRLRHPDRAHLIVEAADSSLRKDRLIKAPLYAASGVTEYWILDLEAGAVEVYRDPSPDGYRSITRHENDKTLALVAFPDVQVSIAKFLGRD